MNVVVQYHSSYLSSYVDYTFSNMWMDISKVSTSNVSSLDTFEGSSESQFYKEKEVWLTSLMKMRTFLMLLMAMLIASLWAILEAIDVLMFFGL